MYSVWKICANVGIWTTSMISSQPNSHCYWRRYKIMAVRLSWYLVVIQCHFWRVTAKDVVSLQLLNLVFVFVLVPPCPCFRKIWDMLPLISFHRWKLQNTFVSCPPWWMWWGCPGWRWHQEWASQRLRETSESPILLIEQPRQAVWTNTCCKLY